VIDDKCAPVIGPQGDTNLNGLLDLDETWTYTCAQTLTETTTNTATVSATGVTGGPVSSTATATVQVIDPSVAFDKAADRTVVDVGQTVTYSYTAANTGNDGLTNVTVTDDKCSPVNLTGGDDNLDGKLDPGETWTYTCIQSLTTDTTNIATFTAKDSGGSTVTKTAQESVDVISPNLAVLKSADRTISGKGDTVNYTYEVTNPGDDPLTSVNVTDDKCAPVLLKGGDTNGNSKLDPGEKWTYGCAQALTESTTNTATVTALDSLSRQLRRQDTAIVQVVDAAIGVTKSASAAEIVAGQQVIYTYKVRNTAALPLSNITVTDDKCAPVNYQGGDTNANSQLDVGEEWTYECTQALTETTTNTGTAKGSYAALTVQDQDSATVRVKNPRIAVEKSATAEVVSPGESVIYGYQVTNPGNMDLSNVSINDNKCAPVNYLGGDNGDSILQPGEKWLYNCGPQVITARTTNTVTVGATYQGGGTVTAEDSVTVRLSSHFIYLPVILNNRR
jgi:hypothetical protein